MCVCLCVSVGNFDERVRKKQQEGRTPFVISPSISSCDLSEENWGEDTFPFGVVRALKNLSFFVAEQ